MLVWLCVKPRRRVCFGEIRCSVLWWSTAPRISSFLSEEGSRNCTERVGYNVAIKRLKAFSLRLFHFHILLDHGSENERWYLCNVRLPLIASSTRSKSMCLVLPTIEIPLTWLLFGPPYFLTFYEQKTHTKRFSTFFWWLINILAFFLLNLQNYSSKNEAAIHCDVTIFQCI